MFDCGPRLHAEGSDHHKDFLALASSFGLGAGFVLTQFGLRWMPRRLGAAISIPTSTLLFWCLAPFLVTRALAI